MLRIIMLAPNVYPIPAVMGGSIETLIQYFLLENIKMQRISLTIYSVDCPLAKKVHSVMYQEANVVYIKRTRFDKIWDKLWPINRAFLKVFKRLLFENLFIKKVYKSLSNKDFDYIVYEGNDYEKCSYLFKKFGREKLLIHWHAEMNGRKILSEWFLKHICISNYVARVLTCNGFIKSEDALVLHDCIDLDLFSQPLTNIQKTDLYKQYNLSENHFVISFVGRIIPEKGVRELLLAFKEICKSTSNCQLLIIGSSAFGYEDRTAYQAELETIAAPLKEKVIFTGFMHHDEMWKLLKLSNLNVFPSICNEGAGMVAMEVMAASIPLITFNVGGIPEYVDRNASIILDWDKEIVHKLSDSILQLINDKEMQAAMRVQAYDHVQKYSIKNYYSNFCDLLYAIHKEQNST